MKSIRVRSSTIRLKAISIGLSRMRTKLISILKSGRSPRMFTIKFYKVQQIDYDPVFRSQTCSLVWMWGDRAGYHDGSYPTFWRAMIAALKGTDPILDFDEKTLTE